MRQYRGPDHPQGPERQTAEDVEAYLEERFEGSFEIDNPLELLTNSKGFFDRVIHELYNRPNLENWPVQGTEYWINMPRYLVKQQIEYFFTSLSYSSLDKIDPRLAEALHGLVGDLNGDFPKFVRALTQRITSDHENRSADMLYMEIENLLKRANLSSIPKANNPGYLANKIRVYVFAKGREKADGELEYVPKSLRPLARGARKLRMTRKRQEKRVQSQNPRKNPKQTRGRGQNNPNRGREGGPRRRSRRIWRGPQEP